MPPIWSPNDPSPPNPPPPIGPPNPPPPNPPRRPPPKPPPPPNGSPPPPNPPMPPPPPPRPPPKPPPKSCAGAKGTLKLTSNSPIVSVGNQLRRAVCIENPPRNLTSQYVSGFEQIHTKGGKSRRFRRNTGCGVGLKVVPGVKSGSLDLRDSNSALKSEGPAR